MPSTKKTLAAINHALESKQEVGFRSHLGASVVGHKCMRYIWYHFRWAKAVQFEGRMLRLFDRGHREEERFTKWLRDAGMTVWETDDAGKQFRIKDCRGHFGGSVDGVGKYAPDLNLRAFLIECKTHNEKSFKDLVDKKLKVSKLRHWIQCQVYMRKLKLDYCLYMAINKNNDELYLEWVKLDKKLADKNIERAAFIIDADEKPIRISNKSTWYECKMCDFYRVCHFDELPAINCRTCAHSTPVDDGQWSCQRSRCAVTLCPEYGCHDHVYNPHMLNRCEMVGADMEQNYVELLFPSGKKIKNGPKHTPSAELALAIEKMKAGK